MLWIGSHLLPQDGSRKAPTTNLYRKSLSLRIMEEINFPITTITGIGVRMGAMVLAGIGGFSRFDSPDKILAYAGLSPSAYQSWQLTNCYSHMEKRGSRYLRYAIFNAAKYVCTVLSFEQTPEVHFLGYASVSL